MEDKKTKSYNEARSYSDVVDEKLEKHNINKQGNKISSIEELPKSGFFISIMKGFYLLALMIKDLFQNIVNKFRKKFDRYYLEKNRKSLEFSGYIAGAILLIVLSVFDRIALILMSILVKILGIFINVDFITDLLWSSNFLIRMPTILSAILIILWHFKKRSIVAKILKTTACYDCKTKIDLIDKWECKCGDIEMRHLFDRCPSCLNIMNVFNCPSCQVTLNI